MKKYLLTNVVASLFVVQSMACGYTTSHNYYMLSLAPMEQAYDEIHHRTEQFWKEYTSGKVDSYYYNRDEVMEVAKQKGDTEMMAYLKALNLYLDNCGDIYNTWDYPTKERIEQARSDFYQIFAQAAEYEGTRLSAQYALLRMRANMQLKRHHLNKTFWEQTASAMPESAYKTMMENIYAGALFHLGNQNAATEIFARQGDVNSIKWSMRGYRNLAGIKKIYGINPNSNALPYLVTEFVNSVQETIDNDGDKFNTELMGRAFILDDEARNFISFANQVVKENKTDNPCMWMTAAGMLYFLLRYQTAAEAAMNEAIRMDGPQRSRDNARSVRLLVMAASENAQPAFLVNELRWLEAQARKETKNDYCFRNALHRIYMQEMVRKYERIGNNNMRLAAVARMSEWKAMQDSNHHRSGRGTHGGVNKDYSSSTIFQYLEHLTPEETEAFYKFLIFPHNDKLEEYLCIGSYKDANYWNDLIGTRYLSVGKFENAIRFLEKVDLDFLSKQNISYYLSHRDFTVERWFRKQKESFGTQESYWNMSPEDGMNRGKCTSNPKLDFCREMLELTREYRTAATNEERHNAAYQLAVRYYQASHYGECWYISNYSNDIYTPDNQEYNATTEGGFLPSEINTMLIGFARRAYEYLNVSANSLDPELRIKSLYALSYITPGWWTESVYSEQTGKFREIPQPESEKYKSLERINDFLHRSENVAPDYISKCDVIRQFRKMK